MKSFATFLAVAAATSLAGATAGRAAPDPPIEPPVPLPAPPALPAMPELLTTSPSQPPTVPPAAGAAAVSAPAQAGAATETSVVTTLQRLVVAELNVVRRAHGRARLSLSPQLTRAGVEHARELAVAGYLSHDWSDGTPISRWIRRFYPVGNARHWSAAENLAWSMPEVTAQQAVELWLASAEHRRNLLDKRWKQVGLGVVRASNARGVFGGQDVVILAAEFGLRR